MEAYLRALERRADKGEDLASTNSVASFFVSRVDTATDKLHRGEDRGGVQRCGTQEAGAMLGQTANANAKLAYQRFLEVFGTRALREAEGEGRQGAASALGEHGHEEQGVQRHAVHRRISSARTP